MNAVMLTLESPYVNGKQYWLMNPKSNKIFAEYHEDAETWAYVGDLWAHGSQARTGPKRLSKDRMQVLQFRKVGEEIIGRDVKYLVVGNYLVTKNGGPPECGLHRIVDKEMVTLTKQQQEDLQFSYRLTKNIYHNISKH